MTMPATLKEFGKELRSYLNSYGGPLRLLHEGDWGAGGCFILAQALVEFLGPPARLIVVSERRPRDLYDIIVPVSHVAVQYDDTYIDYRGAHTEKQFIRNLEREGYQDPEIHPMTRKLAREAEKEGIPCDFTIVKDLVSMLHQHFGP
jgi:hypothetical protein